jgi:flagella basal body P-ring formation protein FlgA
VAELETLVVAKSAGFGLTRLVDTDYLYTRFLKGFSHRYLIETNGKSVRVSTRAVLFPSDSLTPLIEQFLAQMPKLPGEIRRWEIARAPSTLLVPVGPHSLELSFAGVKRKGKVDLNLAIRGPVGVLRNLAITINLRIDQPVLVAKKLIDRDAVLGSDNVSIEMRETTQMNDMAIMEPSQLMGRLAKVTIIPGRVVTPRLVALPPAVKRGQEAKIVFQNGSVKVTSDAVCREDGVVGQIITAKNLGNNRLVRVRVTEGGGLEPIPGG